MHWMTEENLRFCRDWCAAQSDAGEEVCLHRSTRRRRDGLYCACCGATLVVFVGDDGPCADDLC